MCFPYISLYLYKKKHDKRDKNLAIVYEVIFCFVIIIFLWFTLPTVCENKSGGQWVSVEEANNTKENDNDNNLSICKFIKK